MKVSIRHTGIVVQDIEGAIDFWVEILGFSKVIDQLESGKFMDRLLSAKKVRVRTVKLSDGISMIELLHFESPSKKLNKQDYSPFNFGITHIALTTSDIQSLMVRLKEFGYTPFWEPQESTDNKAIVVYISTFEGVLLEIVQPI